MKCPYQTKVIHKSEQIEGYVIHHAQDITVFSDCLRTECPFYHTTEYRPTNKITEHCRRAETETRGDEDK